MSQSVTHPAGSICHPSIRLHTRVSGRVGRGRVDLKADGAKMTDANHQDLILDQFTRQATVFSTAPAITDEEPLGMIVRAARPSLVDRLLDVACGPGLVVCAFAPHVREGIGIDMTPAMLERARQLAEDKGLSNVGWRQGDVYSLPYDDASFTIVTTRFSCHHFLDPAAVLREMVQVCAPGGRVVVVDDYASEDPAKAAMCQDCSPGRSRTRATISRSSRCSGLRRRMTTSASRSGSTGMTSTMPIRWRSSRLHAPPDDHPGAVRPVRGGSIAGVDRCQRSHEPRLLRRAVRLRHRCAVRGNR